MFCGNCGKQLLDGSKFCAQCGQTVGSSQRMQQGNPKQQGTPTQQNAYRQQGAPTQQDAYQQQGAPIQQGTQQNTYQQQGVPIQQGTQQQGASTQQNGYYQPYSQDSGAYGQGGASDPYQGTGAHPTHTWNPGQNGYGAASAAAHVGQGAVRQARKAKRYAILSAALVAVAAVIIVLFTILFPSKTPKDTVADLEKALNKLDTDAMLDCFDAQTQKLYSGSLGLAGSLSGLDLESISDLASGLGGLMAGAGLMPTFKLTVLDTSYSGSDTCMVTVNFSTSYGGETEQETVQLPMKKEGRKWLISLGALGDMEGLDGIF